MSEFSTIKAWVDTHLAASSKPSDVSEALLRELMVFADAEDETLSKRAHHILVNYTGEDALRALATLNVKGQITNPNDYMTGALAVVVVKPDPHTTDGIFTIIQVVPNRYALKTTIRCDNKFVVKGMTHLYLNLFESDLTKPFILTGTHGGATQVRLFEHKNKHDNKERLDEMQPEGSDDPFTITLPNGTVVVP